MRIKYLTKNSTQTKKLGEILAREIIKTQPKGKTFILGLEGDLGGGKTTFLQGFAKGLGIQKRILSPTFAIIKRFKIPRRKVNFLRGKHDSRFKNFYHIDCYRIQKPKEILDLELKKIISNPQNIVAIEWAEKIRKILPKEIIKIKFEFMGNNTRKLIFSYPI